MPGTGRRARRRDATAIPRQRLRISAAIVLLLGGCVGSGHASPTRKTTSAPAAPAPTGAQGAWRHIAEPPIPPAGGMAAAWTGHQLVVWGGGPSGAGNWAASSDGAAYDPVTDTWAVLPPAPVPGRLGASAVWSGREVLFWGGQTGPTAIAADGTAYDPAAGRWRTLPPAPIGGRAQHQAVWTGTEMVVWGGYGTCCPTDAAVHDPAAAAYDPATNRWRRLADVPAPWSGPGGPAVSFTAGTQTYLWRAGRLAAYDAVGNRWSAATAGPAAAPATPAVTAAGTASAPASGGPASAVEPSTGRVALAAVTGGAPATVEILTWTGAPGTPLAGAAYRPSTSTWRTIAPLDAQTGSALVAAGPTRLFAAAGQSARVLEYRSRDDRWTELPLAPVPTRSQAVLAWTGSELLYWGGNGDEGPEMDGAAWRPSAP